MKRVSLELRGLFTPGKAWAALRWVCQLFAPLALVFAPLLGGWQRLDRNYLANWDGDGWDLPVSVLHALPGGDAPARAYDAIVLAGGGSAVEYFGIPLIDPVAGLIVLARGDITSTLLIAWGLPVLFGVLVGRGFCGWFCPFGTLARLTQALRDRLPFSLPHWRAPQERWLRWLVLVVAVAVGALSGHGLLYLVLPHVLLQESAYGLWLMGGGGLLLGWLLGLVVAGLVFGPTVYCATVCPTGAVFSATGRLRLIHLTIVQPKDCGKNCEICSRACWLQLNPAGGDPGPDCDSCGRCVSSCPRTNLKIGLGLRPAVVKASSLVAVALALLVARPVQAEEADVRPKPRLVLNEKIRIKDVYLVVSVVDLEGVRPDADHPEVLHGSEINVILIRGESRPEGDLGRIAAREHYAGPIGVVLQRSTGAAQLQAVRPNWPHSTPKRSIYRWRVAERLGPGDRVVIEPVPGWLAEPVQVSAISHRLARSSRGLMVGLGSGLLVFGGLLSLALAGALPVFPSRKEG